MTTREVAHTDEPAGGTEDLTKLINDRGCWRLTPEEAEAIPQGSMEFPPCGCPHHAQRHDDPPTLSAKVAAVNDRSRKGTR